MSDGVVTISIPRISATESLTGKLKWIDGVLHQEWRALIYYDHVPVEEAFDWRVVPSESEHKRETA